MGEFAGEIERAEERAVAIERAAIMGRIDAAAQAANDRAVRMGETPDARVRNVRWARALAQRGYTVDRLREAGIYEAQKLLCAAEVDQCEYLLLCTDLNLNNLQYMSTTMIL